MDSSSYQRFRLWSGICSIGINIGMVWGAYLFSLAFDSVPVPNGPWALPLYGVIISLVLVLAFLPFEILIGHAAEAAFSRSRQSLGEWLADWVRVSWLVVAGLTGSICLFGWLGGKSAAWLLVAVICLSILLIGFMVTLPTWMNFLGGLSTEEDSHLEDELNRILKQHEVPPLRLRVIDDGGEEGVNGGILPFHKKTFTINRAARDDLNAGDLAALALREHWFHRNGQSHTSLAVVIIWLVVGILFACVVPSALLGADTRLQLGLGGVAVMTTWCFLALLIWPPLSNRYMLEADAFLASKIGVDETVMLLNKIQTLNESEFDISKAKEHVFHPIPSLKKRLEHLTAPQGD